MINPLRGALATALSLVAGAALAHDGFHPHPHGIEAGWAGVVLGLTLIAGAGAALARRHLRGRR